MTWRVDLLRHLAPSLAWSAVILAAAALTGLALNRWVIGRLTTLAAATRGGWDDIVVAELRRRIPLWSILAGLWLSIGQWPLDPRTHALSVRVVVILAAISVTVSAAALATALVDNYGRSVTPPLPVTALGRSLISLAVISLGVLILLNSLGVSITPMLTALGVGGLAVALALQQPLSNLFAGVFVTLSGQIRVGDYIRLDSGLEGYVQDFGWRSARIRQLSNNLVVIPNNTLAQSVVVNFTLPEADLAVLVDVGVDYGSDLEQVERVTIEVAQDVMRTVTGGVPDFTPFIRFHTFADSSINFTTIMRGRAFVDQFLIKHEFVKRLQRRYREEQITIPFPIRTVVMAPTP